MDRGWNLVVLLGEKILRVHSLDRPVTTIGGEDGCRVLLEGDGLPGHPCRLVWVDDDLVLEEPGHPDGPRRRLLDAGDDFTLGTYRLQVVEGPVELE